MAMRLETPSRIWARIERAQDEELPSLPSMPEFEDSAFPDESEGISIQHPSYYPTPSKTKPPSTYTPTPRPAKVRALSTPLSAGEVTARAPIHPNKSQSSSSSRSHELSAGSFPQEYLPPANKDDDDFSTSLTDALESGSRSASPDEFDDNQSRASIPHRSIKDIYNNSLTSVRDADQTRRSNLSAHIKPSPRARISAQAPSPIPTLTHSPRSVTSASSQHTPTIQRLPLSPSEREISYGSVSDRSRNSAVGSRPGSRPASRAIQDTGSERDISYDSLPRDNGQASKDHSREQSAPRNDRSMSASVHSLSQSRLSARASPRPSSAVPPPSESEITYDSVSAPSVSRSRSSPGARAASETPAPTPAPVRDVARRALTASPAPAAAPGRPRYPIPQTPGSGLDGGVSDTPRQAPPSSKLSRSFMMQVINSAARPTLRPKPTPFSRAKFQTPAARRLSQALAIDGAGNSSYVSTASSHDLAIHRQVNASFDAISHARGGAGEFDQRKLRIYLQSLNKHLSDENMTYRDDIVTLKKACLQLIDRLGARGVKVDRDALFGDREAIDLEEGLDGEERDQEVAVVEDLNDELAGALKDLEAARAETEAMHTELEAAQADAAAAREEVVKVTDQCNAQMADLETDVQRVIEKLEDRLHEREAEAAQLRERLIDRSRDVHQGHAEELELEREHAAKLEAEVTQLTGEIAVLSGENRNLKAELRDMKAAVRTEQLAAVEAVDRVKTLEAEAVEWERKVQDLEREVEELDALAHEKDDIDNEKRNIEQERDAALKEKARIQKELHDVLRERDELLEDKDELVLQRDQAHNQVSQMEEALEDAEGQNMDDAEKLKALEGKVAALERERTELLANRSTRSRSEAEDRIPLHEHEALVSDLENQLDDAHREIARLTAKSPAGEALGRAKDLRIEQLEKEKEALLERIQVLRQAAESDNSGKVTPSASMAQGTPLSRLAMMNLKTPRTPGAALKEPSWLNQTTIHALGDADALRARLLEVDAQLSEANESIDDKLDKLEVAGTGVVTLTKNLYISKEKISSLERELARLGRREERLIKRLQRCRCSKCHMRFDASAVAQWAETTSHSLVDDLPTEPPTPETKTTRNLQSALSAANTQLESLRTEWQKLGQENVALRDAGRQEAQLARQAEAEMKRALDQERKRAIEAAKNIKDEKERETALADMASSELARAKTAIAELEEDLRAERGKLRALAAEHSRAARDKTDVLAKLERTNQDMEVVKAQLDRFKNNNKELEKELRSNAIVESKARHLEARLLENNAQIETLRSERELLVRDHEQLQKRFAEITERAEQLRQRNADSQSEHEKRQHRLDMQVTEIESLRMLLAEREAGMKDMQNVVQSARGAQSDAERVVRSLQSELKRVKSEAERLGTDVEQLKSERVEDSGHEKERQKRVREQAQAQMKALGEQLQSAKDAAKQLQDRLKDHGVAMSPAEIEKLKAMHNKECKGLVQHIGYLRFKFHREAEMREHMAWQKMYLMKILAIYAKAEPNIGRALARQGFPHEQPPVKPRKSLRSVAYLVWWTVRAKRLSKDWQEARKSRPAMRAALEDVRSRRPKSRSRT